jgi:hypothetical protein
VRERDQPRQRLWVNRRPRQFRSSASEANDRRLPVGPILASWRCGAKTRSGKSNKRCRMHGGAPGSGAPRGNQNAVKDGLYRKQRHHGPDQHVGFWSWC